VQKCCDKVAGGQCLGLLHHPAALAAHPPGPDVEHLDRRLQLVLGERDDIGVGAVAEHDRLLLHRPAQRGQVVAQPAARSNSSSSRRRASPFEAALIRRSAGHEVAEVLDDAPVLLRADPPDARAPSTCRCRRAGTAGRSGRAA
jgi:hypothetical protein